ESRPYDPGTGEPFAGKRHETRRRLHKVRSERRELVARANRGAHSAQIQLLQVADPAVNDRRVGRSYRAEVPAIDQGGSEPGSSRSPSDTGALDSPAHHDDVKILVREGRRVSGQRIEPIRFGPASHVRSVPP